MQYAAARSPDRRAAPVWSPARRKAALDAWLCGKSKADVARIFKTSRGFIVRMARVDRWPADR
jgi:hypothetical protein